MPALHGNRFLCRANFTLMLTADNTRLHKETNRSRNYGGNMEEKEKSFLGEKKTTSFQLCSCQMLQELHFAIYSFDPSLFQKENVWYTTNERRMKNMQKKMPKLYWLPAAKWLLSCTSKIHCAFTFKEFDWFRKYVVINWDFCDSQICVLNHFLKSVKNLTRSALCCPTASLSKSNLLEKH